MDERAGEPCPVYSGIGLCPRPACIVTCQAGHLSGHALSAAPDTPPKAQVGPES